MTIVDGLNGTIKAAIEELQAGTALFGTASGINTYTVTIGNLTAYPKFLFIIFTNANTGSSTINPDGLGAVTLKKSVSTNLASGDLAAGSFHILGYDGTNYQVLTLGGSTSGGSGTVNSGAQYRIPYYSTNPSGTTLDAAAAITGSRALKSDANGVPTHFDTATEPSLTELTYVKGVTSAIQTQIDGKQATLVSATNIKTINGSSILGSGNLTVTAAAAGSTGQIQFNTAGALDAESNLFWDKANDRLGINNASPTYSLDVTGTGRFTGILYNFNSNFNGYNSGGGANDALKISSSNAGAAFGVQNTNASGFSGIEYINSAGNVAVFTGYNNAGAEFRFNNLATSAWINFRIAGTERLTIYNSGNIGLSTSSDAGFRFDVQGTLRATGAATLSGGISGATTLTGGSLASGAIAWLVNATLNTAASQTGVSFQITGAGSAAGVTSALKASLLAGWTGNGSCLGVYAQNQSAATSTDEFTNVNAANYGEYIATTTGTVVGQAGYASGGNRTYGGMFRSIVAKNSATNIGCAGYARNTGTSPIEIGGYFGLHTTTPTFASAALMCDNGSTTNNIFVARDNGTAVFTIADGGGITLADAVNIAVNATTGTKIGTATTQKIGFWNAAPIVQPTTAVAAATFVANTSAIANDTATFDGYTIGQVVKALRNAGLLA